MALHCASTAFITWELSPVLFFFSRIFWLGVLSPFYSKFTLATARHAASNRYQEVLSTHRGIPPIDETKGILNLLRDEQYIWAPENIYWERLFCLDYSGSFYFIYFWDFFFLDKKSHIHYIFKVDLELPILKPPPLKYWDYRSVFTFQSKHIDSYNPKQFQEMFL